MSELHGKKMHVMGGSMKVGKPRIRGKLHKKKVGNVIIMERKINIISKSVSFLLSVMFAS